MTIPFILASCSPRRRRLLTEFGYHYSAVAPKTEDESPIRPGENVADYVCRLAKDKVDSVAEEFHNGIVTGCDTITVCDGDILGKPVDQADARRMLRLLRGREHFVVSGLHLRRRPDDVEISGSETTRLRMLPLNDVELEEYLKSGLWEGKAGAFGLQDRTGWIEVVDGSETNVVGLPMERLAEMLEILKNKTSTQNTTSTQNATSTQNIR